MPEFELLQHVYASNAQLGTRVIVPPGDDMAAVTWRSSSLLATVDQLIEGRHFRLESTPLDLIGRKAVNRSLSDVAAMACRPVAALATAALPPNFGDSRAKELFDAMRTAAQAFDCPLIGGDIALQPSTCPGLHLTVTVLAEPGPTPPIQRAGAMPGDAIYVTGQLGGSVGKDGLGRHLTFTPRIHEALELAALLPNDLHAMIDISDGLGRDASHIAELSDVVILLESQLLPFTPGCNWRDALSDGEDYELCFAASGDVPESINGTSVTRIGRVITPNERVSVIADESSKARVYVKHAHEWLAADQMGWEHST